MKYKYTLLRWLHCHEETCVDPSVSLQSITAGILLETKDHCICSAATGRRKYEQNKNTHFQSGLPVSLDGVKTVCAANGLLDFLDSVPSRFRVHALEEYLIVVGEQHSLCIWNTSNHRAGLEQTVSDAYVW